MTAKKPRVLIIGAGVTGLSAALHLLRGGEAEIRVVEKNDRVGGLATSYQLGSAIFDFGPHAFHSQQPPIIEFFQNLLKDGYFEINKNVAIKFNGQLYPYPLNPIRALRSMSPVESLRCGLSYFWNLLTNHRPLESLKTAEEFFVRNFGWELYRIFFEGYTHKVWGIHPKHLSASFIRNRLPPASLLRIVMTALTGKDIKIRKSHEVPLKLRIFYPKKGSIQFPQAMASEIVSRGGLIQLNTSLSTVETENGHVTAATVRQGDREDRQAYDYVISTIPVNELVEAIRPGVSPDALTAVRELRFRPILIACLVIKKPQIFSYQTIYYTNRIFNRLAQMNSYSPQIVPSGACAITAEMTCQVGDDLWTMSEQDLISRVVRDMKEEGLIAESDVDQGMVLRNVHGYPIYDTEFEPHLRQTRDLIHQIPNLFIGGRQGMFNYAQMHYGVNSGMKIAQAILGGDGKSARTETDVEEQFFA